MGAKDIRKQQILLDPYPSADREINMIKAGMEYGNQTAYETGVADGKVEGIAEGIREVVDEIDKHDVLGYAMSPAGVHIVSLGMIEWWQAFKESRGL